MLHLLVIFSVFTFVKGQVTNTTLVNTCPSNMGDLPLHVYVEGCINPPCEVMQGSDAVVHVVFKVPRTVRTMKTLALAMRLVNYDLGPHAVTCNFLRNTYCPVLKDEVVQYTLRMGILNSFPTWNVDVIFRVVDSDEKPLWCFNTIVQVVAPRHKN